MGGTQKQVMMQLYRRLQRWSLLHADRTVRFTKVAADALTREYGLSGEANIVVNPMGIEIGSRPRSKTFSSRLRMLFVGRLVESKDLPTLLRAVSNLDPNSWELDIVGDGEQRESLEKLSAELGVMSNVTWHGFQSDVAKHYLAADLFVFPSRLENCPVVLMEAMAQCVPCLAIRPNGRDYLSANDELIDDGVTSLLANDAADFASRIDWAVLHRADLPKLGLAARQMIEARHKWCSHLQRYETLFSELVNGVRN